MALEVLFTDFYHTHENDQFRRIAKGLVQFFEDKSWDGLLIANPENDNFSRFRADAILFYERAFVIIDFKDYVGELYIPEDEIDFSEEMWYKESLNDCKTLEIKGGSHGNPFRQLKNYRTTFYRLLDQNQVLAHYITDKRIQALNIFSGPLDEIYRVPGKYRYYHITDEDNLYNKLVDLNNKDFVKYSEEAVNILKRLFPGENWTLDNKPQFKEKPKKVEHSFSTDFNETLNEFLSNDNSNLLILESMSTAERDSWVNKILAAVNKHELPQVETFIHSSRIKKRVNNRCGLKTDSLYNTIYGGSADLSSEEKDGIEGEQIDDVQEIVGIKSSDWISDKALIILHESHLVTRSLHQSELLKFGTGRLLEDLLNFIDLGNSNRKLICIGDASSLSFGSVKETVHNSECLNQLGFGVYSKFQSEVINDTNSLESLKCRLTSSIKKKSFSNLEYFWDGSLLEVDKSSVLEKIKTWFSTPLEHEPCKSVLVYSNKDAHKINLWIKSNCLSNGSDISIGDLVIVHNNVYIADETGLGNPTRINNGDYLIIQKKLDEKVVLQKINQSKTPISLAFTKVAVKCLSKPSKVQAEVWLLDNYFKNPERLSKEEQIAIKVFISYIVREEVNKNPFNESSQYKLMLDNTIYIQLQKEISELDAKLINGERVKTKLEEKKRELSKVERKFEKKHQQKIQHQIYFENPFVNAVTCSYGWALTVPKAVGAQFDEIILNVKQGETRGVANEDYFRWLYTGLNSTIESANILNHQAINPMMNCIIELGGSVHSNNKTIKHKLDFSQSGINYQEYADNLVPNVNYLIKYIETNYGDSWSFESAFKLGDYQSRIKLIHIESGSIRSFLIFNNGDLLITSIRIETYSEDAEKLVGSIYEYEGNSSSVSNDLEFESIRGTYNKWIEYGEVNGFEVLITTQKPWYDILTIKKQSEEVKVKMTYNGKGFFSKAQLLIEDESPFTYEVVKMIKNG